MYRGPSRYFKVVRSFEGQLSIWHVDAQVLGAWKETGCRGSAADCWRFIQLGGLRQPVAFQPALAGDAYRWCESRPLRNRSPNSRPPNRR